MRGTGGSMTVETIAEWIKESSDYKKAIDQLKEQISEKEECRRKLEAQILAAMEETGMTKFFVDGVGTCYEATLSSVKTPKTPEDKEAFYQYLKDRGEFESLVSVQSQTLNAWYRSQIENGVTQIPGLNEVTFTKQIRIRKG